MKILRVGFILCLVVALSPLHAAPVTGHPRLWLRASDLLRLRSWAVPGNPIYQDGLAELARRAKADMDAKRVPDQDPGATTYVDYPTEMYAELFAFMSLIGSDTATRDDYAQRARTLLMYVIDRALPGAAEGQPFRDPNFSISDRSRWHGEAFALTVDWIYSYLSSADKEKIRTVFLRWVGEDINATTTSFNHPEPIGVVNDPRLVSDQARVRWAGNNYFTGHMRNIGLMSMALDPADDPGEALRKFLGNATGAWLYIFDYLMRTDGRGGLLPEGFEYSPQSAGYVIQLLLALQTAGQDDPKAWGPQVVLAGNPFWDDFVAAYLHSLSPASLASPAFGQVYQPAWYGDSQTYIAPDFIGAFGPLGVYDYVTGNARRLQALRWIETNMAPGGPVGLSDRARDSNFNQNAIFYFMLFDPAAPAPDDPRPSLPLNFFASGLGRILSRSSWDRNASWFTYKLSWNQVDHQNGDGNQVEFYRRGEWLTKERSGYDLDAGGSNNHNTLTLQNDRPDRDPDDYRITNWRLGSQWAYVASGDPKIVARSFGQGFVYVTGDATALYNSTSENATDILHASRSLVWLQPDHIVLFDRAASKTAGRFKRFNLNFPTQAVVSGNLSTMTTASGQKLFVTTVLPAGAAILSEADSVLVGDPANEEPMQFRLIVDALGGPSGVRFLHVLQGASAGVSADAVALIESSTGSPFSGVLLKDTSILFPVDLNASFSGITYAVPASTKIHLITGLSPGAGYDVSTQASAGNSIQVKINTGTTYRADSGGVLEYPPPSLPRPRRRP
ncbi:MAG TPA: hypothetical protein VGQ81_06590 [Acidobacteriota bacterium]|jgi:hypothetical protein|nr:hypothetical protein [Acidobacteriota bacterium]